MRWSLEVLPAVLLLGLGIFPRSLMGGEVPGTPRAAARGAPIEAVGLYPRRLADGVGAEGPGWLPVYVELKSLTGRPVAVQLEGTISEQGKKVLSSSMLFLEVAPGASTRTWLYLRYPSENLYQPAS